MQRQDHYPSLPVQTVGRVAAILELLAEAGGDGLALGEIIRRLHLKPGTGHNLLKSLRLTGLVAQVGTGRYRLGWKFVSLCRARLLMLPPESPVLGVLEESAGRLGEALVLATLAGGRRKVVARVNVRRTVTVDLDQAGGEAKPFWSLVTARVLAAFCPVEEREWIIEREGCPSADQWAGAGDRQALVRALERIRSAGFAESMDGDVAALAVPVTGSSNDLLAALGTFLPQYRYAERRDALLAELRAAAARVAALAVDLGPCESEPEPRTTH